MNCNINDYDDSSTHISPTRYAPHLSEFYSIVNSKSPRSKERLLRPSASSNSLREDERYNPHMAPASVRSGMSTISDLRTLVTKRDIKDTVDAMTSLLNSSENYASSLREVSKHANSMAQALETLARLKGCGDDAAERMLSASGLFYLLANHESIMSQSVEVALGHNLLNEMDEFQVKAKSMENDFKKNCKEQSMKLKIQERHNIKLSRRKTRNLMVYKESLMNLQTQLDQLETLRHDYYQSSYDLVESTCDKVLENVACVSRARVEISENIARKGWSGGGLDDLLMDADDPFGKDEGDETEEEDHNAEHINDQVIQEEHIFISTDDQGERSTSVDEEFLKDEDNSTSNTLSADDKKIGSSDHNCTKNSDFLQGPPTPLRKLSSTGTVKSPLGHKNRTIRNSKINGNRGIESSEPDTPEPAESAFDNSFSLPLAGSARSLENDNDDRDDLDDTNNMLEDLTTLKLTPSVSSSNLKKQDV